MYDFYRVPVPYSGQNWRAVEQMMQSLSHEWHHVLSPWPANYICPWVYWGYPPPQETRTTTTETGEPFWHALMEGLVKS